MAADNRLGPGIGRLRFAPRRLGHQTVTHPLSPTYRHPGRRACPSCAGQVVRVRLQPADRAAPQAGLPRRYRCQAAGCGWQGLVAATARPELPAAGRTGAHKTVRKTVRNPVRNTVRKIAATLLAGIGLAASAVLLVAQADAGWPSGVQRAVAVGESDDGDALPVAPASNPAHPASAGSADAGNLAPLALRQGCAWGKPGRNPYQGTLEQALVAARLPAGLVGPLAEKIRRRDATDRLLISSTAMRTVRSQREFSPKGFAMAFGQTMCWQSRVNFAPGHVEQADFYEVADATGRPVAVMVPDVCGNVSVLSAGAERGPVRRLLARPVALVQNAFAEGGVSDGAMLAFAVGGVAPAHQVPEPGTLGCVIAALAALGLSSRLRRGR